MKRGSFPTFPGNQIKFLLCTSYLFLALCTISLAQKKSNSGNVIMDSSALQLDEIVVTSFGIRREKKAHAYAAQNIGAKELAQVRDLNVVNSLAGKVAGLELIKASSGVGAPSRVVIRGNRSIFGNNQPLYIVDGVPISNYASTPDSEWGGIAEGDGIGNITPEDIEGITVLKGPSATALYGSRANNGAIVITTKKGTSGKGIGVEYSLDYSVETPVVLTRFQNVYGQGASGQYSKRSEFGWGPKMEGQMVEHWTPDPNSEKHPSTGYTYPFVAHPDNFRDFFRMGTNLTNSLALSSGNDVTQVYFSYTNTQASGIVQGNNLKRNNFNLRVTSKMSKRLNLDSKITYFHQDVDNRVSTGDDYYNPIRGLYLQPANISMEEAQVYEY
jgi:TonB-dependent SusC/RagA subfamily outer membrane receptor